MAKKTKNDWDTLIVKLLDEVKKINGKVEKLSQKTVETNKNISKVLSPKTTNLK
jgi:hypothetical protein